MRISIGVSVSLAVLLLLALGRGEASLATIQAALFRIHPPSITDTWPQPIAHAGGACLTSPASIADTVITSASSALIARAIY